MKKNIKQEIALSLAALALVSNSPAQIKLVQNHRPLARIVVTTPEQSDSIAASLLQDFVQRMTKAKSLVDAAGRTS